MSKLYVMEMSDNKVAINLSDVKYAYMSNDRFDAFRHENVTSYDIIVEFVSGGSVRIHYDDFERRDDDYDGLIAAANE